MRPCIVSVHGAHTHILDVRTTQDIYMYTYIREIQLFNSLVCGSLMLAPFIQSNT